jgi:hypothetical protein
MLGNLSISLARRAHFGHNLGEGQEMISLLPSLLHLGDLSHTPITGTVWAHQEGQGILDPLALPYSFSKPWFVNFSVRLFSVTVRTT